MQNNPQEILCKLFENGKEKETISCLILALYVEQVWDAFSFQFGWFYFLEFSASISFFFYLWNGKRRETNHTNSSESDEKRKKRSKRPERLIHIRFRQYFLSYFYFSSNGFDFILFFCFFFVAFCWQEYKNEGGWT